MLKIRSTTAYNIPDTQFWQSQKKYTPQIQMKFITFVGHIKRAILSMNFCFVDFFMNKPLAAESLLMQIFVLLTHSTFQRYHLNS
jgi:hypothetical protein